MIKQQAFCTRLRGPYAFLNNQSGREKVYYHLLRANLHEVLVNIYPRVIDAIGTKSWTFLLDAFLQRHAASTPYFYELPDEFLGFLWHNRAEYSQWPWLWALAHFEWMELVATVANDLFPEPNAAFIRCSPLVYYCQYDCAVYPEDKTYTALEKRALPWQGAVYRNRRHGVHWLAVEPWPALLLNILLQHKESSVESIVRHCVNSGYQEDDVRKSVVASCDEWRELDILV